MILGFFGSVYLTWVFITWLPGYLEIERHMTTINTGFAAGIPFGCGFVGCLVAGWFSDHLIRRGMSPIQSRKLPIVLRMVGMSLFTVPAALVRSNVVALACISMVVFLGFGASACSWALATAAAPANRVASLGAVQNFGVIWAEHWRRSSPHRSLKPLTLLSRHCSSAPSSHLFPR